MFIIPLKDYLYYLVVLSSHLSMFDGIVHEFLQLPLHFEAFELNERELFQEISNGELQLRNNHRNQYGQLFLIFFLS
jgi:hypothetical protein